MDIREKKTRRSIATAFVQLRKKKTLERITVKELAELAEISKATFYLHYKDIYDLSEQLQNQVLQRILERVLRPECASMDTSIFALQLCQAFEEEQELIEILFSGTQSHVIPLRIEQEVRVFMNEHGIRISLREEMLITYTICGGYAVYEHYAKCCQLNEMVRLISQVSRAVYEAEHIDM